MDLDKMQLPKVNERKQQIVDEAIKYCSRIDFTNDESLNEKGRKRVTEWAKQDFIAGAEWMYEQLCLSNVKLRLLSDLKRFQEETEKPCFYTKSDKIKRVKLLLDVIENLQHYLDENV